MTDLQARLQVALASRYAVERELGQGGMAFVFLAQDLKHHRSVAIKLLRPELAALLGPERFLREIEIAAGLSHPHILPLHDSGAADGFLYYVMPFVEGESLRDRLTREKQLPIEDAVRIAREVADALGNAHAQGVIHRDIKPENILLQGGHALVADFGIALAVQTAGGQRMTQTGLSVGTPQYMSPEQAMGERAIDARSDVYALGAVLYEMLTGEPPFTGATVQAIVAKVMHERPVPPRSIRDTVPANVEAALLKALAKLPADRYAGARELYDALALTGVATGLGPVSEAERGSDRPRGSWTWKAATILLGLAAAAGWVQALRARRGAYSGPAGCEAQEGVWKHVSADVAGIWIVRDGYGVEYQIPRAGGPPRVGSWREVACTPTTIRYVVLESSREGEMSTGKELTDGYRIEEGVFVWRHVHADGTLGPELRGERLR